MIFPPSLYFGPVAPICLHPSHVYMHAYNIEDTVVNMHAYALSIGAGIKSVAPGYVEDTVVKMQSYV